MAVVPDLRRALMDARLPWPAKLVGFCLAEHMDGRGRAQVGKARLAQVTGLDPTTVRRAIRQLEAGGLVEVERSAGGRHMANRYQAGNGGPVPPFQPPKRGSSAPVTEVETGADVPKNGGPVPPELEGLEGQTRAHTRAPARGPATAAEAAAEFRRRLEVENPATKGAE